MNKQRIQMCFAVFLLLLCLLLAGCASSEESPVTTVSETAEIQDSLPYYPVDSSLKKLNYDLDYTTAYYGFTLDAGSPSAETRNLSGTKVDNYRIDGGVIGCQILASMDDLAAFEQTIEEVTAASLEWKKQDGQRVDEDNYGLLGMTRKTANVEYNEEFFQNNALLLIDLCVRGANVVRFYPENLALNGDIVSIDVRWDRDNAWLAGCSGQFCLIVIPSGCTTVEMNLN